MILLSFLLASVLAAGLPPLSHTEGTVQERVECLKFPGQSYALFLPPGYVSTRLWPILFCFDPGGRGMLPLELFREPAARHGFIIASSHDFYSDGEPEPAWEAMLAVYTDVTQRLPIDPDALYATGFSGGGRMIWVMATESSIPFTGLIGVGAGFPWAEVPEMLDTSRLSYRGIVGETDFNFYEVQDLGAHLDQLGIPNHIVAFEGPHTWPPASEAGRALDWLVLERMVKGYSEWNPEFLQHTIQARVSWSQARTRGDDVVAAVRELEDLARQVQGTPEFAQVSAQLEQLKSSKGFKEQKKEQKRQREYYEKDSAQKWRTLDRLQHGSGEDIEFHRLEKDLGLSQLARRAKSDKRETRLAAQRVRESVLSQTGFYIARQLKKDRMYKRLQTSLRLALEVAPESPNLHYSLARAYALDGDTGKAFESLERAINFGFNRAAFAESDSDLESLHELPKFAILLSKMKGTFSQEAPAGDGPQR